METKTVTLVHGYVNPEDGECWKEAEIRIPLLDDEIKAQEACGDSTSQSLFVANLLNQCCVRFGPKPSKPGVHVIRALRREDSNRMFSALVELEYGSVGESAPLDEAGGEG